MKVANDPTDGLPVDLEEAGRQLHMREAMPAGRAVDADQAMAAKQWIDAAAVIDLMVNRGSSRESGEYTILQSVSLDRNGRAAVRAKCRDAVFMPASFSSHPVERHSSCFVETWMWWGELVASDWGGGTFSIKTEHPYGTWTLHGVEFLGEDLAAHGLVPKADPNSSAQVKTAAEGSGRRGRKREPKWNDFVAELTLAACDGEVTHTMTSAELLRLVNNRLAAREIEGMEKSTVQETLNAVLARLRADEADDG